ncbi:G-protein coupled receptor 52 isoform X1 [Copidosoma floridanum]|uniref:G-protein coupled receptor 52 isoform X1 n=1 Tax=Copidosoma floridanum TaxID=29053 RepID=UPI0006C96488|nr:G-protein coupled receptor 52 isoform X1 [Copidosoma floridanum]XP_014215384.1 G-protein coupled receptor 52 isoform X1 [Copidosoma floridanum]
MEEPPAEALMQAGFILVLGVAIILSNLLIIATYLNFRGPSEVMNYYLLSLALADLLCGLLVVPFSVYPALVRRWVYGDVVCRLVGYLEVTLWAISVYTFMWISVDRYLAIRKPLRYETVQTKTRCQCWMAFTWISVAMMCCPPLLGFNKPLFDREAFICMLDWGNMAAYTITLSILVLGPSVITIIYTYTYIFSMMRKLRSGVPIHDKEYATALSENLSNPSHIMSFVLVMAFWISWAPYAGLRIWSSVNGPPQMPFLHFGVVWFGILNSFWKAVILGTLSPQFRLAARVLCLTLCCRHRRLPPELLGLDDDD